MKKRVFTKAQKKREEVANTLSHAVGIPISIAVITLLVVFSALYGNVWHIVSFSIFGASMLFLYTASTIFHGVSNPRTKFSLNKLDHSAIYILIAGSYTPMALTTLRGPLGWTLFGIVWALAIGGIVYKIWFYSPKYRKVSTWLYIGMGWLVIIVIGPVIENLSSLSLWLLFAGGISYSVGALFYLRKGQRLFHFIFHLFVLAGSILHFLAFLFMLPLLKG
ncbi:MAG: hemolysin III family protein [Ignavibacteria bacterium]|nr:hemolysin III family protein [Ignavibacteria bacterium]